MVRPVVAPLTLLLSAEAAVTVLGNDASIRNLVERIESYRPKTVVTDYVSDPR